MPLTRISALFFIILFISGISSCGKTGKLYLPDEKVESVPPASQNK
jgi:predicted small lipoprotein YifL